MDLPKELSDKILEYALSVGPKINWKTGITLTQMIEPEDLHDWVEDSGPKKLLNWYDDADDKR